MTAVSVPILPPRRRLRWRPSTQGVATVLITLFCAGLVGYPIVYLVAESLNVGDPGTFPPEAIGLDNYVNLIDDSRILSNTGFVACIATVMAVVLGFLIAWTLTRTRVPGRAYLERLMQLPYYLTPLVGALAWAILAGPKTGFLNQLWHFVSRTDTDLFNIYSPWGIAWVMALFEGTVAFVMISAAMKSMDPSLEESSRVLGAGKWRTMLRITLPLVTPGVLGATVFVFAEMLGSFAAALVLGVPGRFFVITTSIWEATLSFPPDYGRAAAMGIALFAVMFGSLTAYRWIVRHGNYATITGKAFRPRPLEMGGMAWLLFALCCFYVLVAVVLPLLALTLTSFQRFATVFWSQMHFTLANYQTAFGYGAINSALGNSLLLGVSVATIGVLVIAVLVWIIYRSRVPGHSLVEYVVMFPQAVPRMVFGLGILWAWLNIPIPIYGTLWLLALAYFTVMLPLGVRTLAGVVLQIDKSLEECARVCGASWSYQLRTVTLPLLRPGIMAAWLLLFIACVRELGVSIFLVGPNAKVIAPSIVSAWISSSTELSAALALIQSAAVFIALIVLLRAARRYSGELP
ncbi:MAG TPA: iron ABC transporter permease [Stellaceae bacterium]|jgi:iron(III) transport system permease protein|nr:iron ABC transporter permease [Stellaceae bacterium]